MYDIHGRLVRTGNIVPDDDAPRAEHEISADEFRELREINDEICEIDDEIRELRGPERDQPTNEEQGDVHETGHSG